ncbi:rod shape-determining protein MreD [Porphyromonas loveana]|uniref:rod shape-determining protein MreD n=1 Tax=Porphyromonas loveana TaxID=1884669 RepID=UPI0035A1CCF3
MFRELKFLVAAVLLILLQVWIFNYIYLFRIATPFLYIYLLMLLPLNTSVTSLLWRSFIVGAVIDILSGVPGLHAAAFTAVAFVRNRLAQRFMEKDSELEYPPSSRNLKSGVYILLLELTVIHHFLLFVLDFWSLQNISYLLMRMGASMLFTYLLLLITNSLFGKRMKMSENE